MSADTHRPTKNIGTGQPTGIGATCFPAEIKARFSCTQKTEVRVGLGSSHQLVVCSHAKKAQRLSSTSRTHPQKKNPWPTAFFGLRRNNAGRGGTCCAVSRTPDEPTAVGRHRACLPEKEGLFERRGGEVYTLWAVLLYAKKKRRHADTAPSFAASRKAVAELSLLQQRADSINPSGRVLLPSQQSFFDFSMISAGSRREGRLALLPVSEPMARLCTGAERGRRTLSCLTTKQAEPPPATRDKSLLGKTRLNLKHQLPCQQNSKTCCGEQSTLR